MKTSICILWVLIYTAAHGQIRLFPYFENFDTVKTPTLPSGWNTSTNRSPEGDFTSTKSSPYSDSVALVATNATIEQTLSIPQVQIDSIALDSLIFFERRSSSFNSVTLLEASTDGGITYPITLGDSMRLAGSSSYVVRRISLPASLSENRLVRLRWHLLGNGTGSTGTFRIDDVLIRARSESDLALCSLGYQPSDARAGDTITISASVRNVGIERISGFNVTFYIDSNPDSVARNFHVLGQFTSNAELSRDDSASATLRTVLTTPGRISLIGIVNAAPDRNSRNDTSCCLLTVGVPLHSIVINEIMYAPSPGEPEWIELFNPSPYAVDLDKWKMGNHSLSRYTVTSQQALLLPKSYCVITKDTASLRAIHPDMPCLMIQPGTLPTFFLNNQGDALVLYDSSWGQMDSVRYSSTWGGSVATSLERIDPTAISNDSTNWGNCGDSGGSTPGYQNFLTPLEHNLRAVRLTAHPSTGQEVTVDVTILNIGRESASQYSVTLYADLEGDSVPHENEELATNWIAGILLPRDSVISQFPVSTLSQGANLLIATVEDSIDMRASDNRCFGRINITSPRSSLIINEIMYDPTAGHAEYVELFNPTQYPINVQDWKLSDKRDTTTSVSIHTLTHNSLVVLPDDFVVVATDSSILRDYKYLGPTHNHLIIKKSGLSLNNGGDELLLCDLTGMTIDSLRYSPEWNNPALDDAAGKSLERINPILASTDKRNWTTCADPLGGTPGKVNSVYTKIVPLAAILSISPNPFSPDGDGFEDVAAISYHLPLKAGVLRIRIYDSVGRLMKTLADGAPTGSTGTIIWNGMSDRQERVRIGIYIVFLEAYDITNAEVCSQKAVVVVATKL